MLSAIAPITLCVTYFLALLGSNFTHNSPVYSILGAIGICICAVLSIFCTLISRLWHIPLKHPFLSALNSLCAFIVLIVGCISLIADYAAVRRADEIAHNITYRYLPIIVIATFLFGLFQLQWQVMIHSFFLSVGPIIVGISTLAQEISVVQLGALITLIVSASALLHLWFVIKEDSIQAFSRILLTIAVGIIILVMLYALSITIGSSFLVPSHLLAWAYIIPTACAFIAALFHAQK